jgi:hypothetical protein
LVAVFLAACASVGPTTKSAASAAAQKEKRYAASGQAESLLEAINAAKRDAVRKAVVEEIGDAAEKANSDVLEGSLYTAPRVNAFIIRNDLKTVGKSGGRYMVEGPVVVDLEAVSAALDARNIRAAPAGGSAAATVPAGAAQAAAEPPAEASPSASSPAAEKQELAVASPAQAKLIDKYIAGLSWMVYFAETSGAERASTGAASALPGIDPMYARSAVAIANGYLTRKGFDVVSAEQIEKLKAEDRKVYEAETGEAITITQWIAQKLSADVYLEIGGTLTGGRTASGGWGQANVTLDIFETSTATLLASVPWNSPRTVNTTEEAARINALQASVEKAMPIAMRTATEKMSASARANGIRYDLIVHKTPDARAMSSLRSRLRDKVLEIKLVSQSDAETRMRVSLLGTAEELADAVLDASARVPELAGMRLVLLRGKSLTFDTGM